MRPSPPAARAPQDPEEAEARSLARSAVAGVTSLDELAARLDAFEGCALRATARRTVFSDGNPDGRVMIVGEAPGRDEDLEGRPFVGRSGQLLDRMLAAIGLDRNAVYIGNVIFWRPPGNRTPTPAERAACRPFIETQIRLADPDILVTLGKSATSELIGLSEGITRTRGHLYSFDTGARRIAALPMLHPAALLRNPVQKRLAWRDMLTLKALLALDKADLEGRIPGT